MSKFRDFLAETDSDISAVDLANALTRTLGRKLTQQGWSTGPRGSGIVAMVSNDEVDSLKDAVQTIQTWLKGLGGEFKMKPGKITGDMSIPYKGYILSAVETNVGFKILIS